MSLLVKLFYWNQSCRGRFYGAFPRAIYRFISYWLFCTDLHSNVTAGAELRIYHGIGLVVNPDVVLGRGVILRHGVTIGNLILPDGGKSGSPKIGDNVEFGCGSVCIGDIVIGNNVRIGANAVVTVSIPDNRTVVGFNRIIN